MTTLALLRSALPPGLLDGIGGEIEAVRDAVPSDFEERLEVRLLHNLEGWDRLQRTTMMRARRDGGREDVRAYEADPALCDAVTASLEPAGAAAVATSGTCAICTESLAAKAAAPGDAVVLPCACAHAYHRACIRRWLAERRTCPTCRFALG